ncbi:hypothetical protein GcM3_170013 [Golovinomyces cichoracearum]|uniref:Uncharacterized protein n=1 Tax=Golovinomyces cichoracearum TaxID=62708 RepID=A0A420HR06_9PEZI|nr:hypothetical protein GcM3_170013 [Golovinomyces cichoracearum]
MIKQEYGVCGTSKRFFVNGSGDYTDECIPHQENLKVTVNPALITMRTNETLINFGFREGISKQATRTAFGKAYAMVKIHNDHASEKPEVHISNVRSLTDK